MRHKYKHARLTESQYECALDRHEEEDEALEATAVDLEYLEDAAEDEQGQGESALEQAANAAAQSTVMPWHQNQ
eukprot:14907433-Ditylum_brightwellii.AAC.1